MNNKAANQKYTTVLSTYVVTWHVSSGSTFGMFTHASEKRDNLYNALIGDSLFNEQGI